MHIILMNIIRNFNRIHINPSANFKINMKRFVKDPVDAPTSKQIKSESSSSDGDDITAKFQQHREDTASSILEFSFDKKRVRILSEAAEVPEKTEGILYWMSRDARVQDNWAFLFAQKLALKNDLPLYCCFSLVPKFLDATIRHYKFMLKGLMEVEKDLEKLDIQFNLLIGHAVETIPKFVKEYNIGGVVCDFSPLRVPMKWVDDVKKKLPENVPFCQVDAHNIVPVWETSEKQEYAARTIRNKITSKLDKFLSRFPPLIKHKYKGKKKIEKNDWEKAFESLEVNMEIDEVDWAKPGYRAGCREIKNFCEKRLRKYNEKRNDPLQDALSNLSPWFHFGHISVQRTILYVKKFKKNYTASVDAFCEEAIVRRELSDNFCFYNENYDNINNLHDWAKKTLNEHRKDKREYIYTKEEFETAKTHDDLWNSAQIQLIKEGKMHGFLRMYWAKKILEWTKSPEEALEISIYLNDKYSLDGRDPNGYVGCMWSIGGLHDRAWGERAVFGKIRFMNYAGCKGKFTISAFVARYGGKVYKK